MEQLSHSPIELKSVEMPTPASPGSGRRSSRGSTKARNPVRTIAVTSGKGGVGKTNVVANLAVALRSMGKQVLILDADIGLSNVDILLRLAPRHTVAHVLSGAKNMNEVIIDGPHGIKVLPAAFGAQELTNLDEFQRMRLLDEFGAYDGEIDVVLVDTSAGISENVAFFCIASQETMVVTTPEPTALAGAYALIKVLSLRYQEKRFCILVNAARGEKDATEVYRKMSIAAGGLLNASLDYMGFIPLDEGVHEAVRSQALFMDMFPDGPASRKVCELASRLIERPAGNAKGTLQFFIENLYSAAAEVR